MRHTRHFAALAAATLLALAALTGCGAQPSAPAKEAPQPAPAAPAQSPSPEPLHTSTTKVVGDERAVLTTSRGVIEIAFYPAKAPNAVASFVELANNGFYNGTKFHRVEPGILIQGGDPLSKTDDPAVGTGGPGWRLKAEFSDQPHIEGTVAMARMAGDDDSAGSQFYIGIEPLPGLDGQYTVFGHVVKGMDVVQAIQVGDVITSITIVHGS